MDRVLKGVSSASTSFGNLSNMLQGVGRSFEKMGRTLSITGFILGMMLRRVQQGFMSVVNAIKKVVEESSDSSRAMDWFSNTLQALALSGTLTADKIDDLTNTFLESMDISFKLGGAIADLEGYIMKLKNAIASGAIEPLKQLNTKLGEVDFTQFFSDLRQATTNFLTPIVDKIGELIGGEGLGGIGEALIRISTPFGEFVAGMIQGIHDIIIKVSEFIGGAGEGGLSGLAEKLGNMSAWLGVAAFGLGLLGLAISPLGALISGVVAVIGGAGALTLIAVLAGASLEMDYTMEQIGGISDKFGELLNLLGLTSEAFGVAIPDALYMTAVVFKDIVLISIELVIDAIIKLVTWVQKAIDKLRQLLTLRNSTSINPSIPQTSGSEIPLMAEGGIVTRPTFALIGERGPEAIVPLGRGGGFGGVTIIVNESSSPEATGRAVYGELRRRSPILFG